VSQDADNIAANELDTTELQVTTDADTAAFAEPVRINGTLTTTDSDPVANETITLQFTPEEATVDATRHDTIAPPIVETTTDANGSFSVRFHPVQYPREATTLRVSYLPEPNSIYFSSSTTTPLTLSEQAMAALDIETAPATTRFGESLRVAGSTRIETEGGAETAPAVPIVITLAGQSLGATMTAADGTFELDRALPLDIPAVSSP